MRRFSLLMLIALPCAATLPSVVFAQPQQSENLRMTKSVLDAGGGTSTSASFQLVSAFGQPAPVGVQNSANFVLYAGFLEATFQLSPISPIQQLVIQRVGNDMRLWWEAIVGAESYRIFRAVTPLFTPGESNQIGSVADTTFADAGVVSLPPIQYFYIVTAINEHNDPVAYQGVERKQMEVRRRE